MANFLNKIFKGKNNETVFEVKDTMDMASKDICLIEDTLSKLELINLTYAKTEELTSKISFYKDKLKQIRLKYLKEGKEAEIVLKQYSDERTKYLLDLSILADEINDFSKGYFYLEDLVMLLHEEITESNINKKMEELKELEKKINAFPNRNQKIEEQLQEKLIDTIWYLLEQEIKLGQNPEFYRQMSQHSQLSIQKRFLEKLIERVEDNYIQNYLKQNGIQSLVFDYEMFIYMTLGKVIENEVVKPVQLKTTLLEISQIFGDNALGIFKKRGTKAAITDYAILLGGYVSDEVYLKNKEELKYRTGWYWTKTRDNSNKIDVLAVDSGGNKSFHGIFDDSGGVRAILPYSSISNISLNERVAQDGILEVEFGEYPRQVASEKLQSTLEDLFQRQVLSKTEKSYTTEINYNYYTDTYFQARKCTEYEYNGSKYIRCIGNPNCIGKVLSNGKTIERDKVYWVKIEPIKCLVDKTNDIALTEELLFSGVEFYHISGYNGNFKKSGVKWFLDNCFSKEIIPSKITVRMGEESLYDENEISIESFRKSK